MKHRKSLIESLKSLRESDTHGCGLPEELQQIIHDTIKKVYSHCSVVTGHIGGFVVEVDGDYNRDIPDRRFVFTPEGENLHGMVLFDYDYDGDWTKKAEETVKFDGLDMSAFVTGLIHKACKL